MSDSSLWIVMLVVAFSIPLAWAVAGCIITIRLVSAARFRRVAWFAAINVILALALTVVAIATFHDLLGPGYVLALSAFCISGFTFLATLLFGLGEIQRRYNPARSRQVAALFLVGGLIVPGSQAAVGLGTFGFNGACDHVNFQTADRLIGALEQYRADHGDYPKSLADLVPAYVDKAPQSPCHNLNIFERELPDQTFAAMRCPDGSAMLVVGYNYGFWRTAVYSTATHAWDRNAEFVQQGCHVFH